MRKVISNNYVDDVYRSGKLFIEVGPDDLITPLAQDRIRELGMVIKSADNSGDEADKMNIVALGCDHTGYKLKILLKEELSKKGFEIIDVGTNTESSCDYPDYALAVAQKVIEHKVDFGIMVDATGVPSAITANKVPGIRAATCYNEFTAWSARNHNNANIMVVGAKAIGDETAKSILNKWLETNFEGGRHQNRLDKITKIEEQFYKAK
jgi:ribose 5-phosphate isomerase B